MDGFQNSRRSLNDFQGGHLISDGRLTADQSVVEMAL